MNAYTFTAKEVELLIELIATADNTDQDRLAVLSSLSEKLNRKHERTTGKCGDYWYTDHNGALIYATKTPPKDFITPNTITIDFNKPTKQEPDEKEVPVKPCLSVSNQAPETFDQSGFEALRFTEIGDVTDYGDFD